mmetsp:Transcript_44199/g.89271  ORF Transcript_44199/g.89271 Transcript_44199/m.89271 type:complete len:462 (+) Transcript_44199:82-1467(+)
MQLYGYGSLYLAVFLDSYGAFMVLPLLPFLALSLNASPFEVGLMQASYCFTQTVGTVILGSLSDRIGRRRVMVVTLFFCSASLLAFGLSSCMWQLIIFRSLHGFFASTVSVCEAILADGVEPQERAGAMATVMAAFGLGLVLGPSTGGLLVPLGFQTVCFVASGLTFANTLWALWQLPSAKGGVAAAAAPGAAPAGEPGAEGGALGSLGQAASLARSSPDLVLLYAMTFAQTMAFGAFMGLCPLFLHDVYGIGGARMGLMFACSGAVMVLCQSTLTGFAAKRLGESRSILVGSTFRVAMMLAFATVVHPAVPWVSFIGMVASMSLIDPCMASMVATIASDENRGAVLGVYQALRSLGECAGPLWAGAWYEASHEGPFLGSAGATLLGGCLVCVLQSHRGTKAGAADDLDQALLAGLDGREPSMDFADAFALPFAAQPSLLSRSSSSLDGSPSRLGGSPKRV